MKSHLKTLLPSVSTLLLSFTFAATLGCSADGDGSDGDPDHGDDTTSRTDLDLAKFRKHAMAKLKAEFGDHDFSKTQILFMDGFASDLPPVIDLGRLSMVVDQPAVVPQPGVKLAYMIGMDGTEGPRWVTPELAYFQTNEAIAILDPGATSSEIEELVESLNDEVPGSDVQVLEAIGLLLLRAPDGAGSLSLIELASSSELVTSVDLSADSFPVPFEFGPLISLGTGKKKKIVDLIDSTSITKQMRADGFPFLTEPSLPEPFGPGRFEPTFRWVVTVVDGFEVDDCVADALTFEGIELIETVENTFTIEATSAVASVVLTLQCVESVDQETP